MSQAACTNVRLLNDESSISVSEKKQSLPRIHLSQPRLHPVVSVGRWPLEANPVSHSLQDRPPFRRVETWLVRCTQKMAFTVGGSDTFWRSLAGSLESQGNVQTKAPPTMR